MLRTHCLLFIALLSILACAAATAAPRQLTAIEPLSGPGQQVALRLTLDGPAPDPRVFTIDDPARLSIDLPNTTLALSKRYRTIAQGPVQAVNTASADGRTRVVVQLTRLVDYRITRDGDALIVSFGSGDETTRDRTTTRPAASAGTATAGGNATAIQNIDFRRGDQDAGRIEITLNGDQAPIDVERQGNKVVATLPGIQLPNRLARRLDVTDFKTPVETIDAMARGDGTRLVITPEADANFQRLAYQTGNRMIIELQPISAAEQRRQAAEHPEYNGKKISLSFQNVDVRSVLQIIADVANVNMVVADNVSGTIALQLDDVPWDQALDIILDARGLGMQRNDNVITVAPLADIAAREKAKAEARQATNQLAPLQSEIIQINYADAADMANILQSNSVTTSRSFTAAPASGNTSPAYSVSGDALSRALGSNNTSTRAQRTSSATVNSDFDEHSLLSPRGHVTVDSRTNSLLVTDTAEKLDQIRSLIDRLDVPVRQVLIESRIVIANRDFTRNLGVSQTGVDSSRLNNALAAQNGGDIGSAYDANNGGYSVALPATNATSVLSSSIITDTFSLNLELSAMESENNGEIISSPRVITTDGREANIEQGREIPYQSGSSGSLSGTSVEFKKAVLGLNVTPKITPDKKVIMNLNVTQDSVGEFVPTSNGGSVPSIDTRSLNTQVLVNNGDTVVLGGIYEQNNTNQTGGVPFLRKIPLLGALFRSQSLERQKRELLIFVTPRILDTNFTTGGP
ncbi:type IV pilus secretin family protein [Salinisphaera sp. Q1T1-3]|uniref:type IV pilus secretin family protein n=1 Tax=Salinisphaera sp. Q1T1-3 TaxID=2321229 RepID=UPI001314CCDE|nr:type IV pilus secretin family protein [Salinisphaera sp. Q1T1-3]